MTKRKGIRLLAALALFGNFCKPYRVEKQGGRRPNDSDSFALG